MWILFSIISPSLFASDDNFEGEIVFRITYEDGIEKQILDVLPTQSTLLIKDRKSHSYTISPLGNQGVIYDDKKEVSYSLVDFFSTALAIKKNKDDLINDRNVFEVQKIQHTNESKIILGYSCRKILVTAFIPKLKKNIEFIAFYTLDLGNEEWINNADPIYYQVKGLLLEYEIQMGSVFMSLRANKINPRKVSDSELKIPNTHKIVSPKEAEELLKKQ